jgi:hypothetical protein
MALIECPECGRQVSDQSPSCIHCGFPMRAAAQRVSSSPPKQRDYALDDEIRDVIQGTLNENPHATAADALAKWREWGGEDQPVTDEEAARLTVAFESMQRNVGAPGETAHRPTSQMWADLPGLRSRKSWKAAIAICGYLLILVPATIGWHGATFSLLFLAGFFLFTNAFGVRSRIPVLNSRNPFVWVGSTSLLMFIALGIWGQMYPNAAREGQAPSALVGNPQTAPIAGRPQSSSADLVSVGQPVAQGGWEVTVTDFGPFSTFSNRQVSPPPQGKLLVVAFTAKNLQSRTSNFASHDFELRAPDGRKFAPAGSTASIEKGFVLSQTVQPGLSTENRVVFDVDPAVNDWTLQALGIQFRLPRA